MADSDGSPDNSSRKLEAILGRHRANISRLNHQYAMPDGELAKDSEFKSSGKFDHMKFKSHLEDLSAKIVDPPSKPSYSAHRDLEQFVGASVTSSQESFHFRSKNTVSEAIRKRYDSPESGFSRAEATSGVGHHASSYVRTENSNK